MRYPLPIPTRTPPGGLHGDAAPATRRRRGFSAVAAAALTSAALAPGLGVLPASASPTATTCGTSVFSASAAADLLRLNLLDLNPTGLDVGPFTNVVVAPTKADTTGGAAATSTAEARYLTAKGSAVEIPAGVLDARAYQESPPVAADGVTVHGDQFDVGALSAGSGHLTARTTWPAPPSCAPVAGPTARSEAAAVDAMVLPGLGNGPTDSALVHLKDSASSNTVTGLVAKGARLDPTATAAASVAKIHLLAGTPFAITANVVSQPKLTVTAAGSKSASTVEYTSPVLDVTLPHGGTQRLDNTNGHIDIPLLPVIDQLPQAARTTSANDPLSQLLRRLATARTASKQVAGSPLVAFPVPVIRLSLGEVTKTITDESVKADADSLRLQVVFTTAGGGSGNNDGYGGAAAGGEQTILDLGVGVLHGEAAVPPGGGGGAGEQPGGDTGGPGGPGGNGGASGTGGGTGGGTGSGLPVTGPGVAYIVGGAVVLLVAGRFLMIVTRRRFHS